MRTVLLTILITVACCAFLFFLFFYSSLTYPQPSSAELKSPKKPEVLSNSTNENPTPAASGSKPTFIGPPPGPPRVIGPSSPPPGY